MRLFVIGILCLLCSTSTLHAQSESQRAEMQTVNELLENLREGGYVVYLRHADTTGEPLDRTMDLSNRQLQRNLSAEGRQQAKAIGQAIERLGIKTGTTATSPVFRARDTAELAFGEENVIVDPWLTADDYVAGSYGQHVTELRAMLSTVPQDGNTWLVGHIIPLSMAVGGEISRATFGEGAAAVFRPTSDSFELMGILPQGWEVM